MYSPIKTARHMINDIYVIINNKNILINDK